MKKTSVDQLTKAVGIAKGSFYKFYESKEMLFFAVLDTFYLFAQFRSQHVGNGTVQTDKK